MKLIWRTKGIIGMRQTIYITGTHLLINLTSGFNWWVPIIRLMGMHSQMKIFSHLMSEGWGTGGGPSRRPGPTRPLSRSWGCLQTRLWPAAPSPGPGSGQPARGYQEATWFRQKGTQGGQSCQRIILGGNAFHSFFWPVFNSDYNQLLSHQSGSAQVAGALW